MHTRFVRLWLCAAAVVVCSNLNNKADLIESQTHTISNNNLLNGLVKIQKRYFDGTELHTQVNLLTNNFLNASHKWEINWLSVLFTASFIDINDIKKESQSVACKKAFLKHFSFLSPSYFPLFFRWIFSRRWCIVTPLLPSGRPAVRYPELG